MPAQIKIVVKPDGSISTVVEGVQGPSCKELSSWLAALGKTVDEGATADAYQAPDIQLTDAWADS